MALPVYLAMTPFEYGHCLTQPAYICWMACQFSSHNNGLSNIPNKLPENALLMLNDQFPINGHDPTVIAQQLLHIFQAFHLRGIILDMQRPYCDQIQMLSDHLTTTLPCPVAITPKYIKNDQGPVFIPPIPSNCPIEKHLKQFSGREIWLELDRGDMSIELTAQGSKITSAYQALLKPVFQESKLCCHYHINLYNDKAEFQLCRTKEDTSDLIVQAEKYGVTLAVGLYQEMNEQFYLSTN